MRIHAPLLCVALLGCATSPARIAAPPEPAVDIDALIARDGLLAIDGDDDEATPLRLKRRKALVSSKYYELDGAAPPELIVHIREAGLGPSTVEELWFYDVADASAPRLLPTPSGLAARGVRGELSARGALRWVDDKFYPGWWRAEDLDGDGRAEVVIAGSAQIGMGYAPLSVWGWGRDADGAAGMIDRLWRDPGGLDPVAADVDGDGRRELVFINSDQNPAGPRLVVLKPDKQGRWREVAFDLKKGLPAVLDALSQGHPRVQYVLPTVVSLMRLNQLAPRDLQALQRALEARVAAPHEETLYPSPQEMYLGAMAWPGNTSAYDVLLPYLERPDGVAAVAASLELDAQTGQQRGRARLLAWLGEAPSLSAEEVDAVLEAMESRGIEDGAALVAKRIMDPAVPQETREALLTGASPYLYGQLGVISPLWSQGKCESLCGLFLETLASRLGPSPLRSQGEPQRLQRWREALSAEVLLAWLAIRERGGIAARIALVSADPKVREQLFAVMLNVPSAEERTAIMDRASDMGVPPPHGMLLMRRDAVGQERDALARWVVSAGDNAARIGLLDQTGEQLIAVVDAYSLLSHKLFHVPKVPCVGPDGGPPGCTGARGALLDWLPQLHNRILAKLGSGGPGEVEEMIRLMGRVPYEPTQQLLLGMARDASSPLSLRARRSLIDAVHPIASGYLMEVMMDQSLYKSGVSDGLGRVMNAVQAQELLGWLATYPASVEPEQRRVDWESASAALELAAPRACAAQGELLVRLVDDGAHTCEARASAASALALCDASWLEQLSSDARLKECGGALLLQPLERVAERGERAHLPALERLAEDPRSRVIRELAHGAAMQIRAR